MRKTSQHPRGSVLWVALIAIVVAISVALSLLQTSMANSKSQDKFGSQTNAFFATHGSVDYVISDLYGRFNSQATLKNGMPNFAVWLSTDQSFAVLAPGSSDSAGEDFRAGPTSFTAATSAAGSPSADPVTLVKRAMPTKYNDTIVGDRMITAVRLYKKERPKPGNYLFDLLVLVETQKNIGSSTASQTVLATHMNMGVQMETLQPQWESQMFSFSSPPNFNGFDYALLTKNLSCTMCHLQVRNRARIDNLNAFTYNTNLGTQAGKDAAALLKQNFGTFDRSKVGITENLTLRQNSMYSLVEGTLYQRGVIQYETNHSSLSAATFVGDTAWGSTFNPGTTQIAQDPSTGLTTRTPFYNQTTDASGNALAVPAPNGSFYWHYGSTTDSQSDGNLPSSNFPSPYPEIPAPFDIVNPLTNTKISTITGPNNRIDASEVTAASADLKSAVNSNNSSSITGGVAVMLDKGQVYQENALPSSTTSSVSIKQGGSIDYMSSAINGGSDKNVSVGAANIVASTNQNVILTGTATNPIKIDGKVLIDGDLVLRGYVQGTGQLYVTGNVYMPGDVIYNNKGVGTTGETFGTAADGTTNLLGVVAGKNIVVGDYISQITTWDSGNANQFAPNRVIYGQDKSGNPTVTVTPTPGSTETGNKLTYVPGDKVNNFLNATVLGSIPTVHVPSGTINPDGSAVSTSTNFGGSNEPNFIMQQLSILNREELMKTMPNLPTSDPTVAASYTTAGGAIVNNATNAPAATAYDPNYIPKFYSFYPYDAPTATNPTPKNPALALLYNGSPYNSSAQTWNGEPDPHGYDYMTSVDNMPDKSISDAGRYGKNVINVSPDWIPPSNMLRIVSSEQESRVPVIADAELGAKASSYQVSDRRLDGVMYTKNAVFCIERSNAQHYDPSTGKWSRVKTVSGGRVQVNGAIIAPDTGLLIADGGSHNNWTRGNLVINYDARVKGLMSVANQDFTSFNNWGVTRVTMVRNTGFAPAP